MNRTLSSEIVHTNDWYRIRCDQTQKPDGTPGLPYYLMERPPFCLVVAEKDGSFLLAKEERYTTKTMVWDFPGGWIEEGEDPAKAALREFAEETGWRASEVELLCAPYAYVGISKAKSYIYRTVGQLECVGQKLDETEDIKPVWMTRSEIAELVRSNAEISGDLLKCIAAFDLQNYR